MVAKAGSLVGEKHRVSAMRHWEESPISPLHSYPCTQVLPKLSSSIVHEIDSILGNKPYSKKDYRS